MYMFICFSTKYVNSRSMFFLKSVQIQYSINPLWIFDIFGVESIGPHKGTPYISYNIYNKVIPEIGW